MQLLHLQYFKLLAENEHLLNTAKMIHISAPALSTTISKLENELGVDLFDRVGRKIKLNENGKILYAHVCNIFSEIDSIKRELSKTEPDQQDIINIAVSATTVWNEVIGAFMKEYPNIIVKHAALRYDQMQDAKDLEEYDFIITHVDDINSKLWDHEVIIEDPPALLVNPRHPFAKQKVVPLFDARNEPFIALPSDYSSFQWFENSCKQAGFIPRIVAEADYILRTQLVESGYGIAFSSVLGARGLNNPGICMVRVKYPPYPRMQTIFWKAGVTQSKACELFRSYLINFYKGMRMPSIE